MEEMWRSLTKRKKWMAIAAVVAIVGAACGGAATAAMDSDATATPTPGATPLPTPTPAPEPTLTPVPNSTPTPTPQPTEQPSAPSNPTFFPGPEPDYDPAARFADRFFGLQWRTDFSKHSVDYDEIFSGGVPKDGIRSIDRPKFIPIDPDPPWLADQEPVISLEVNGDARAYPIQILTRHEIVNDVVGGVPVIVTFCPLCNTAIAFDRTVNGRILEFGVSGLLRFSDLVMYDRSTETWWQQIGGEAIVGELTGTKLRQLPASIISWKDFRTTFPNGKLLSTDTGFNIAYGRNPYPGYDDINDLPFLFLGPEDGSLRAMERVVTVDMEGEAAAYPFLELENVLVVTDTVGGAPIAVFFAKGTVSGLDSNIIAFSRDVGAGVVYSRVVDGRELTFVSRGEEFVDNETGTTWSFLGQAIDGPLAGKNLEPVLHANHFWFAWAAFKPETRIWRPEA